MEHVRKSADHPAQSDAASVAEPRLRSFAVLGHVIGAAPISGGLHVVATPIGNLGDITLRALSTLAAADVILAEDTRQTGVLLAHYAIRTPVTPYHEHNAERVRPRILAEIAAGKALALVSDAGTPLVSDPGYRLAREVAEAGHAVTALPGASALLAGLVVAGLPTDRFTFDGFLPSRAAARRARLRELADVQTGTIVLFESPRRLAGALADAALMLGDRPAAVARELTKYYEEVRRGTLPELAAHYAQAGAPRGEIVLLIGPGLSADTEQTVGSVADIDSMLTERLATLSLKEAVAQVSALTGEPRKTVYARALAKTRST